MQLADLSPTGRVTAGPLADIEERVSQSGHLYTALRLRERLAPDDVRELHARGDFLRSPAVAGLAELELTDMSRRTFVYPTGQAWTLAEVLPLIRDQRPLGPRAGLELCYVGAVVLQNAAMLGEARGVWSHGGLTPWRILLEPDGDVQILGHGLPGAAGRVEDAPVDVVRYASPERLSGELEDVSSDLFSLTLIALEVITGAPVYDGSAADVLAEAQRASGARQLHQWREVLTEDVRNVLGRAIRPYPDARWDDPEDYIQAIRALLESPIAFGPSLARLMADVERAWVRDVPLPTPRAAAPVVEEPRWEAPDLSRSGNIEPTARLDKREQPKRSADERLAVSQRALVRERILRDRPRRSPPIDGNTMFPRHPASEASERYLVRVEGGPPRWAKLDPEETLACSAARLADALCPTPLDCVGILTGWYRIGQGEASWYGDTRTRVLDPEQPIELEFTENRLVPVVIVLPDERRVEVEVGTAVHAQLLLSGLQREHELRGRTWGLFVGDRPLDRWQILDDYDPGPGFTVHVLRQRARRR